MKILENKATDDTILKVLEVHKAKVLLLQSGL